MYPDNDIRLGYDKVLTMSYLDAVLHESMRIIPIGPIGLERMVPKEGTMLGDYFIPGGVSGTAIVIVLDIVIDILVVTDDSNIIRH